MTWFFSTRFGLTVSGLVLALTGVWLAAKKDAEKDRLDDYIETRKRADDANLSSGDIDDDIGVLRDFAERRGHD